MSTSYRADACPICNRRRRGWRDDHAAGKHVIPEFTTAVKATRDAQVDRLRAAGAKYHGSAAKAEYARQELHAAIVATTVHLLSESELARIADVSRTTIRKAISEAH